MILAAYIYEHGMVVLQATNRATSPYGQAAAVTLDSLLRLRAQELCSEIGASAVKRVVVRRCDKLLLFCLAEGAQAFVCACTDVPERAFSAFSFLADICVPVGPPVRARGLRECAARPDGGSLLRAYHLSRAAPLPRRGGACGGGGGRGAGRAQRADGGTGDAE